MNQNKSLYLPRISAEALCDRGWDSLLSIKKLPYKKAVLEKTAWNVEKSSEIDIKEKIHHIEHLPITWMTFDSDDSYWCFHHHLFLDYRMHESLKELAFYLWSIRKKTMRLCRCRVRSDSNLQCRHSLEFLFFNGKKEHKLTLYINVYLNKATLNWI